jgi:hypothetical protein
VPGKPRRRGLLAAIAAAAAVVIAAGVIATQIVGHHPATASHLTNTPSSAGVTSLKITPATVRMTQHHTVHLLLTGLGSNGSAVSDKVLAGASWASADSSVAVVGPDGTVTATGTGSTYITAQIGNTTASAQLNVSAPASPTPTVTVTGPTITVTQPPPPSSSPTPDLTPVTIYKVIHTCRADNTCGLNVHSGPANSYQVIGTLTNGEPLSILCQTEGQFTTNSRGSSSSVWDQLTSGGYISDEYTNTDGARISATESGFAPDIAPCPS